MDKRMVKAGKGREGWIKGWIKQGRTDEAGRDG